MTEHEQDEQADANASAAGALLNDVQPVAPRDMHDYQQPPERRPDTEDDLRAQIGAAAQNIINRTDELPAIQEEIPRLHALFPSATPSQWRELIILQMAARIERYRREQFRGAAEDIIRTVYNDKTSENDQMRAAHAALEAERNALEAVASFDKRSERAATALESSNQGIPQPASRIKQAIAQYERLHKQDRKITLKQICLEINVNYGSTRALKSRYAKQKRKHRKS